MAHWKRLTRSDGVKIDVNMDAVAYIQPVGGATQLVFGGSGNVTVMVKELIDQIQLAPSLNLR